MTIRRVTAGDTAGTQFRHYDVVMTAFVVILMLSNLIGAAKLSVLTIGGHPFIFGAGILFFPLSYVLDDVLTEVYGFARARRVIWVAAGALIFMAAMEWVVVNLPPAAGWGGQAAYESVFGAGWRIVLASLTAFWAGDIEPPRVCRRP